MCFSASASFGASVALGTIGIVTLTKVKQPLQGTFCYYPDNVCRSTVVRRHVMDRPFRSRARIMETFSCIYFSDLCPDYQACVDSDLGFTIGKRQGQEKDTNCINGDGIIPILLSSVLHLSL